MQGPYAGRCAGDFGVAGYRVRGGGPVIDRRVLLTCCGAVMFDGTAFARTMNFQAFDDEKRLKQNIFEELNKTTPQLSSYVTGDCWVRETDSAGRQNKTIIGNFEKNLANSNRRKAVAERELYSEGGSFCQLETSSDVRVNGKLDCDGESGLPDGSCPSDLGIGRGKSNGHFRRLTLYRIRWDSKPSTATERLLYSIPLISSIEYLYLFRDRQ